MSAYIVDKETIDRVVTELVSRCDTRDYPTIEQAYRGDPDALGKALWDLNVKAVNWRYNEVNVAEPYTFACRPTVPIQALKSIRCLLYQCSKGDIPQDPLFQDLDRYSHELAFKIVRDLPEWEEAEWA